MSVDEEVGLHPNFGCLNFLLFMFCGMQHAGSCLEIFGACLCRVSTWRRIMQNFPDLILSNNKLTLNCLSHELVNITSCKMHAFPVLVVVVTSKR